MFPKRNNRKKSKKKLKQNLAGMISPKTASIKIQSISRGRSTRQSKKVVSLKEQILSRRKLVDAKFKKVDFTQYKLNGTKFISVEADGAKFHIAELKKTIANNSSFNGASFFNADLDGFKANSSTFNKCKFDGSANNSPINLKNCEFASCEMKNCNFNYFDISGAKFIYCNLKGSSFNNFQGVYPPIFAGCVLDSVSFIDSPELFTALGISIISDTGKNSTINNLKIEHKRSRGVLNSVFSHTNLTFNDLHISNLLMRDEATFDNCIFNNLKLHKNGKEVVQFFKLGFDKCSFIDCDFGEFLGHSSNYIECRFKNCNLSKCDLRSCSLRKSTFIDCDFGEFLGHSSNYIECTFQNCNLSKCDLRSCSLRESTFINCNMNGVKFVRSKLTGVNFIDGTVLTNIDFQECEGMDGMNFQGLNLQGAKMIGISDPGLNACNFRDANLRGVQFDHSEIHGSDFTGADLTGSNVRVAEGSDQTVGIPADQEEGRAVDTHKTFYNIRINMLVDFYVEKTGITTDMPLVQLRPYLLAKLRYMIDNLNDFEIVNNSEAIIITRKSEMKEMKLDYKMKYLIKKYIKKSFDEKKGSLNKPEFKELNDDLKRLNQSIKNLEKEIHKRILILGLESCFTQRLNTYNFSQIVAGTDPQIKFNELIYYAIKYVEQQPKEFQDIYVESFITDSTQAYGENGMSCAAGIVERFITVMEQAALVVKDTISEKTEEYVKLINIITNDPKSLIKNFQQEWFEFHKEGGPNAFLENTSIDEKMDSYKAFLEKKFDYANLRGANQEKIKNIIIEDPNAGVNITREYIQNEVIYFGGRIKGNKNRNFN